MNGSVRAKPKLAFFDFASCEGCQLTVLDCLQTHPELLDVVEIVEFREAMTGHADGYDVAFVEGSFTRASDEERLRSIRARSTWVGALGACAHIGGINAMRNDRDPAAVSASVYGSHALRFIGTPARPIGDIIDIDFAIPGCPIDPEEFIRIVTLLLQGRSPDLPDYPVCIECKLRDAVCVYGRGAPCLGPITRAGCHAVCPGAGHECLGCRGLTSNPNLESMRMVMAEHGLLPEVVEQRLNLFLSWEITRRSKEIDGG
jgi:sulfhydrogenase subunit delta